MPHIQLRQLIPAIIALITSALLTALFIWLTDTAPNPVILSVLATAAGLATLLLPRKPADNNLGQLTSVISEELDHMMIGSAQTSHFVDSIKKQIDRDVQTTKEIAISSEHNASMTSQIASNAERAARVASEVRNQSVRGRSEVDQGLSQIVNAREDAQIALTMMSVLQEKSRHIHSITEVITQIAAQTNLLALNAAIEAARAGEHGRGFAVVAGEVRQLGQRTKSATDDISTMVSEISEQAERAATGMKSLTDKVTDAVKNVELVHSVLSGIEHSSIESQTEVEQIAAVSREHAHTTQLIADAIVRIHAGMLVTESELPLASSSAMALTERAETLFETMVNSKATSSHDVNHAAATKAAKAVGQLFEEAIKRGQITEEALFNRTYKPIPNTDPVKHTSSFDAFADQVLPEIQEKVLTDFPTFAYAASSDNNGYFPTHNDKFSQPLTGDYATDLINNRTKRIYKDRTGSRAGANTKPFLLQTYKRDTGEVIHDLSVPIYVGNRHWGAFRIGYFTTSDNSH